MIIVNNGQHKFMRLDTLSSLLATCPYPDNLVHIDRGIEGSGYYPGARGLANGTDPTNGIMLVGRDFGLYSYYVKRSCIPNADETMYTWQRTVDCILDVLPGNTVWAMNYLLGARKEPPATGNLREVIPAHQWRLYEQFCWVFLGRAALLQKPRHIVLLGGDNHKDLTAADRLQTPSHTFRYEFQEHTAQIQLAPHPSSLRRHVEREKARAWYRTIARS